MVAPHHLMEQRFQAGDDGAGLPVPDPVAVDADDGLDFDGGAAEEDLVGDVQLGALHVALKDGDVQLVFQQFADGLAGDALEDAGADRRRDGDAVADDEDAGVACFGDLALLVENDAVVVAVDPGLGGDVAAVLVVADCLGTGRHHVVGDSVPTADVAVGQLARSQVGGSEARGNHDLGRVFPDSLVSGDAAGEVGQGLDVGLGAEAVGPQQSGDGLGQLFRRVETVHPHDFHGLVQALEVGVEVEDE